MSETCLEVYLTRHGESLGNIPRPEGSREAALFAQNPENPPLSDLGERQIVLLGERLSGIHFDAMFTSPLHRALDTALAVAQRQSAPAAPLELLTDLVEAGTRAGYAGDAPELLVARHTNCIYPKDGPQQWLEYTGAQEPNEDRLARARRLAQYFRTRFQSGEKIFVCAHGTFNTYLIRALLGMDNSVDFNFCQENTNLSKVKYYYNGLVRLSFMNDVSHLYAEIPDLSFTL